MRSSRRSIRPLRLFGAVFRVRPGSGAATAASATGSGRSDGALRRLPQSTRAAYPLLLNVQNDLLGDLYTRMVVPLCPAPALRNRLMNTLTPLLEIKGDSYVMLTPQLASIAKRQLGEQVADVSPRRDAIIAALDTLITGI